MYSSKAILNPVVVKIQDEYHLNSTYLKVSFFPYILLQILTGVLGDKIGKRKILMPSFILFRIFTAISMIIKSWYLLLTAKIITKTGQATYFELQFRLSSAQIPKKYLSLGGAIINSETALKSIWFSFWNLFICGFINFWFFLAMLFMQRKSTINL